jgi:hypothetical protein
MASGVSRSSTREWARVQSPRASHYRASRGAGRLGGGVAAVSEAVKVVGVMGAVYIIPNDGRRRQDGVEEVPASSFPPMPTIMPSSWTGHRAKAQFAISLY